MPRLHQPGPAGAGDVSGLLTSICPPGNTHSLSKRTAVSFSETASYVCLFAQDLQKVAVGSMLNRTCGVSIAGVAQASNVGRPGMSMSMVPGLVASSSFNPERAGCSRSVQVCVVDVDVDPESDEVNIVGWAIGHDRGRVISPCWWKARCSARSRTVSATRSTRKRGQRTGQRQRRSRS